jgi:hypothetical protein
MSDVHSKDSVTEQAQLAALLTEQLSWRGTLIADSVLLDALGMAGMVLAGHDEADDLNPATVAAILLAMDDSPPGPEATARIFSMDAYRRAAH